MRHCGKRHEALCLLLCRFLRAAVSGICLYGDRFLISRLEIYIFSLEMQISSLKMHVFKLKTDNCTGRFKFVCPQSSLHSSAKSDLLNVSGFSPL